jgi:hypothetical protein
VGPQEDKQELFRGLAPLVTSKKMSFSRNYYVPRAPLFGDNGQRRTDKKSAKVMMIFEAYVWDVQILTAISDPLFVIPFEIQQIRTSKSVLNSILAMKRQKEQLQQEREEREEKERKEKEKERERERELAEAAAARAAAAAASISASASARYGDVDEYYPSAPSSAVASDYAASDYAAGEADEDRPLGLEEQPEEEKLTAEQQLLVKLASDRSLCASRRELQKSDNSSMGLYHDYDEMTELLRAIADRHSHIAKLHSIGRSLNDRHLWVLF